jgi:hypothetical protein
MHWSFALQQSDDAVHLSFTPEHPVVDCPTHW